MVQWLGLHIPNVGGLCLILGQGTRSHMLQLGNLATAKTWQGKEIFLKKKARGCEQNHRPPSPRPPFSHLTPPPALDNHRSTLFPLVQLF